MSVHQDQRVIQPPHDLDATIRDVLGDKDYRLLVRHLNGARRLLHKVEDSLDMCLTEEASADVRVLVERLARQLVALSAGGEALPLQPEARHMDASPLRIIRPSRGSSEHR